MADDDAEKAKRTAAKELMKEAFREFKAEEEEKTRTATPPPAKKGSLFDTLFGS